MIRLGDYRDVLDGETWDALICDPPYSAKTHKGQDFGKSKDGHKRRTISYAHWTPEDVAEFVAWAAERTRGWMVCMTDHLLIPAYQKAYEDAGRYAFAPVPWLAVDPAPRKTGDGPLSSACYIMVSRPKIAKYSRWGCLPGHYLTRRARHGEVVGAKPLLLMMKLVEDYSREGDLVCDPTAGGGTTLWAAGASGRRIIGSEVDPATHKKALKTISLPWQTKLID